MKINARTFQKISCLKSSLIPLIALIIVSLFLASCDPNQILILENQSNEELDIIFIFSKTNQYYEHTNFAISDTQTIHLDKNKTIKEFNFGIGSWDIQNRLDSLCSYIEVIEISQKNKTKTYNTENEIKNFMKEHLSGRFNERIHVIFY